jgi:hypothetical protein
MQRNTQSRTGHDECPGVRYSLPNWEPAGPEERTVGVAPMTRAPVPSLRANTVELSSFGPEAG